MSRLPFKLPVLFYQIAELTPEMAHVLPYHILNVRQYPQHNQVINILQKARENFPGFLIEQNLTLEEILLNQ